MITWWWLILAFFAGTIAGVFMIALLAAGRDETAYRAGFVEGHKEGHTDGFKDGLKEFQHVG